MNKSKGFTLIEAMIVAAIVGILAAIALPAIENRAPAQAAPVSDSSLFSTCKSMCEE